jgi:hypothetical protein
MMLRVFKVIFLYAKFADKFPQHSDISDCTLLLHMLAYNPFSIHSEVTEVGCFKEIRP